MSRPYVPQSERGPAPHLVALHQGGGLLQQVGVLHLSHKEVHRLTAVQPISQHFDAGDGADGTDGPTMHLEDAQSMRSCGVNSEEEVDLMWTRRTRWRGC